MRVNLTHNDNIKTFDDVARHIELEKDRILAEKHVASLKNPYMVLSKLLGNGTLSFIMLS